MKIDRTKIEAIAKPGHPVCLGTGIVGRHVASNTLILCHCVWRALKAKGIYPRDTSAVREAIGEEKPSPVVLDEEGPQPCTAA